MKLVRVRLHDWSKQLQPLFEKHLEESGYNHGVNPSVEGYTQLEESGNWFIFVAFIGSTPIGYSSAFVSKNMHNPDVIVCISDAVYVIPKWRKTTVGGRLIVATEQEAKHRGAKNMLWSSRKDSALHKLLEKRNHFLQEVVVFKEL